jgi:hypothetical protein
MAPLDFKQLLTRCKRAISLANFYTIAGSGRSSCGAAIVHGSVTDRSGDGAPTADTAEDELSLVGPMSLRDIAPHGVRVDESPVEAIEALLGEDESPEGDHGLLQAATGDAMEFHAGDRKSETPPVDYIPWWIHCLFLFQDCTCYSIRNLLRSVYLAHYSLLPQS